MTIASGLRGRRPEASMWDQNGSVSRKIGGHSGSGKTGSGGLVTGGHAGFGGWLAGGPTGFGPHQGGAGWVLHNGSNGGFSSGPGS
jgi:hypothetical protein